MLSGAVARRYAQAVFEIGTQQATIDRWHDDLRVLAEYFGNRRLAFVLKEPKIPFARKEAIVRDLLADKVGHEALNLALLLVERGYVDLAPAISNAFTTLYNDYRGQAVAQVTTAVPLDEALRASITSQLQQTTGKRILLQERVDPSILGGAIARVGDTLIDGSLRRRFQLLRQQILQGGFFGGPEDGGNGTFAALPGPGGDGTPSVNGSGSNPNGPVSSTESAPRPSDQPHLGPKPSNPGGAERRQGGRPTNNKRRRR